MEIGGLEALGYSWRDETKIFDHLRAVTADEVKDAALQLTGEDTMTEANLVPLPIDPKAPRVVPQFKY